ncbi:MAG: molybdate ABC transporter permease subunit [Chloroflexota bacterium]|nr:MAG: molybdate ABC transporter permease subunit [Chloroflexota bacterium]
MDNRAVTPRKLDLAAIGSLIGVGAFALLIGLPVLALVARAIGGGSLLARLTDTRVIDALLLSLATSTMSLALAIALGTPVAYGLARGRIPGARFIEIAIDLPIVLPPAVAGIALLMAFGRRGVLGPFLEALGIEIAFTTTAVILAQVFVAAPLYVRAARAGFAAVDPVVEGVARTLGASPWRSFRTVTIPLALPSLVAGAIMCWARALGEFGATIMVAGSLPGQTRTMPLAIYQALESDLNVSLALSAILVGVAFAILLAVRAINQGVRAATEPVA